MNRNPLHAALRRLRSRLGRWPDSFLWDCDGVVHIGANTGQERDMYHRLGLRVLWVEPIPSVFAQLRENLTDYPAQEAVQALVSETDGAEVTLHIASNNGESSSILPPAGHLQSWPEVRFDQQIRLPTVTLPTLLERNKAVLPRRTALVLDTQGAELMILRGAGALLRSFRYVKAEGADYVAYECCPTVQMLDDFMREQGFVKHGTFAGARGRAGLGSYYDLVYRQ